MAIDENSSEKTLSKSQYMNQPAKAEIPPVAISSQILSSFSS
jgi:hypothetical protein